MTAYAYLRKSSVSDPDRDLAPETQEREVRALAARFGDDGPALRLLADWDVSGRREFTSKRTNYLALVAAIDAGDAKAVYSYSLSRLGRSVSELSKLFDLCQDRRVPIRLVADAIDTSTASGILTANMLSSVAQFEAQVTSERIKATHQTKLLRGESLRTVRFFGEQRKTKKGELRGGGEDLQAVLDAFDEAGSYSGAAKLLNDRGVKPRSAMPRKVVRADGTEAKQAVWWPSSVSVVVRRCRPMPTRSTTRRGTPAGGTDFILAGMLRCPTCGTRLTGLRDRDSRRDGPRVRYACRLGTVTPHPRTSVSEHLILPSIRAEASHLATPGDQVESSDVDEQARHNLEQRRLRILDMFEAGNITREERESRLAAVYDALARLDERRIVVDLPEIDWTWPPKQLNAVVRALFEEVTLDPVTFQPVAFKWTVPEWRS